MRALQKHFTRGGRTNQFFLFARMINLRLDLNETEMLAHMANIDSLVSELESTGFTWTSESKLVNNKFYSLDALYPQKYSLPSNQNQASTRPRVNAVEVLDDSTPTQVEVSALDWSSDGFGLVEDEGDVPVKYLFDGGTTDAVSNDRSILMNYCPLLNPIPIKPQLMILVRL